MNQPTQLNERSVRRKSYNIIEAFQMLWAWINYRAIKKRKAEQLMRSHVKQMIKQGKMNKLGGRLRLAQQIGKMKHARKTGNNV